MYLKSVQIVGFKSFPDKIRIDLLPGINAFVGPNGCGKSNLVDAIRWGLGEQNPYALRGTKMEDMIFAGTESRKPLGMAEVSLTFEKNKNLGVPLSRFTITRRLFRSGESEYYLNKTPVRLKDIQDIFRGTGLGSNGYAFLSLEMVEFILFSRPRERRNLFDELAGITGYKFQKQKILKEIEKNRENLQRLTDITQELERQLRYIRRQASRARRYKELQEKIRNLEIGLALREYISLSRKKEATEKELLQQKSKFMAGKKEEEKKKRDIDLLQNRWMELTHILERNREKETILREEIARLEGEIRVMKERKEQLITNLEESKDIILERDKKKGKLREEKRRKEEELKNRKELLEQKE
ncbi:MAG TPA: chromosome segregation protein SMC, partial [bacterium]|nr:chromosome segregation protein SMC [bacterium]HEX68442.1 chromosome segregation protein SMC [bacterium]